MNQRVFIQKIDEILNSMNVEELKICIHNIARKAFENKRESLLQLLEDCYTQGEIKDGKDKLHYKRLLPDENVEEKLKDIKSIFSKLEDGELSLSAQGYEDYSNGYWSSDWIWEYEDNDGIGSKIQDALLFAHDCINDCRYEEAVTIFNLVMDTSIHVDDEYGGDSFELSLEEMINEKLAGVNLKVLALDVLYSNYQLHTPAQRAGVLYSFLTYSYFKDVHIEDIFSIGREELRDTDIFWQSWIDYLIQQRGDVSARLLKEALLYFKGTEGLLEMARIGYKEHPSVYLGAMLEYEKLHDYEKMKEIGEEALSRIDDDMKIRGEIAMKAAQAANCVNDSKFMRKCWYEAFYSNSTIPNYLRLFANLEATMEYKEFAEIKIGKLQIADNYHSDISETDKNSVNELKYKYLCFFAGRFDKIHDWCKEQKNPLGWSGSFISHGIDLMLLYLYAENNLRRAGKKLAVQVSNTMGFNDSKNLVLMKENSVFETEVSVQKGEEIFWNIFCLWKVNYAMSVNDKQGYVEWLESVIDKRIDAIVGGKFRSRYEGIALLVAALGEVKESLGMKTAKNIVVNRYLARYPRHSAFRGALKEYID